MKFSNFKIKVKKTDASVIYVPYAWHHAGGKEMRKGLAVSRGP